MSIQDTIRSFLSEGPYAVVGASRSRAKYGNKVLRCYLQHDRKVFPLNRRESEVEGLTAYPDLASVPEKVHGLSIITPPPATEKLVEEAARLGIQHVWMQPGAESDLAISRARELGLSVIAGGPCLLVALGYDDSR